jgi:hypothetical protein
LRRRWLKLSLGNDKGGRRLDGRECRRRRDGRSRGNADGWGGRRRWSRGSRSRWGSLRRGRQGSGGGNGSSRGSRSSSRGRSRRCFRRRCFFRSIVATRNRLRPLHRLLLFLLLTTSKRQITLPRSRFALSRSTRLLLFPVFPHTHPEPDGRGYACDLGRDRQGWRSRTVERGVMGVEEHGVEETARGGFW